MLFSASTVKDTLPHVQRFVAGNLAGGIDHMFVFLDGADPEVRAFLDGHPNVTCVRTDKSWWHDDRPEQLNIRQRINANVAKVVLSGFDWAEWVFHFDADEIAQIDRDVLAGAPAESRAARLAPLEVVSRKSWDGEPTWFKRLLGDADLTLLHTLGVIDKPNNAAYFHGHLKGKIGVRPALDVWLTLHTATDAARNLVEPFADDRLRVLHYESFSGEEFVRKWTTLLAAGPKTGFRPSREPTAVALQTLIGKGLTEEQAAPYLMKIFERTTEDDLDTLRDLDLLVEADPSRGTHVPVAFPEGAREQMEAVLEALRPEPKRPFHPGQPAAPVQQMLERATGTRVRAGRSFLRRS